MTKFKEKAQGQVKQAVGQIVGDDQLVLEGKKQQRAAEHRSDTSKDGASKTSERRGAEGHASKPVNKPASEQTDDPTGRKGPVLD